MWPGADWLAVADRRSFREAINSNRSQAMMPTLIQSNSTVRHLPAVAIKPRLDLTLTTPLKATRALPGCDWRVNLCGLIELLGGSPCDDGLSNERFDGESFTVQRVARGAMLMHEGAQAHNLFVVQSGSFKCVKTAEDGYEHVLGFMWRGDVIGYDGLAENHYAFAAVALEDSRVVALPVARLAELRRREPALDAALQCAVSRQVAHAGEIAELMAAVAADVRLARFLVQLSARMAARGQSPRRILLCMNRRDIASHIGVAHETISRSLRLLSEAGLLRVNQRDIEILDLAGLRRCARVTRGANDDVASIRPDPAVAQAAPCFF
jgi:CRP/FNR family transcriptional regulator, anaerobic regulatory protein